MALEAPSHDPDLSLVFARTDRALKTSLDRIAATHSLMIRERETAAAHRRCIEDWRQLLDRPRQ